ncbi:MAG: aminoglycoside phosphotransferase family protein [Nanoarchaeota archaeon]
MLKSLGDEEFENILKQISARLNFKGLTIKDFKQIEDSVGGNNFVYYVNNSQKKFVLKIGLLENDYENFKNFEFISQNLSGKLYLPVPKVFVIGRFASLNGEVYPFMVEEFFDGSTLRYLNENENEQLVQEVAKFAFKLHNDLKGEIFQRLKRRFYKRDWYLSLVEDVLKNIEILEEKNFLNKEKSLNLQERYNEFFHIHRHIFINSRLCFLHGDLYSGNFIVNKEKTKVIVAIDWDFAKVGDPASEVALYPDFYLESYINLCKNLKDFNEEDFRERVRLYQLILLPAVMISLIKKGGKIDLGKFFQKIDERFAQILP